MKHTDPNLTNNEQHISKTFDYIMKKNWCWLLKLKVLQLFDNARWKNAAEVDISEQRKQDMWTDRPAW